jgi:phenylacetate-coenzyme A ligase PaaK-like adenylate-forming protein
MASACEPLGPDVEQIYHANTGSLLELVDSDGAPLPIEPALEGELVITTTGAGLGSPLVRYRLGDKVRVISAQCPHGSWTFAPLGRAEIDFIKIAGGIVSAAEVERVLRTLGISDRFEMHLYQDPTPTGPKLRAELYIESASPSTFTERIMNEMRISPVFTYAKGVTTGHYLPLTCKTLSRTGTGKHMRLIRHW